MTLLDSFIRTHEIDPEELARLAKVSDAHLVRLRDGRSQPSRDAAIRLARACSWITSEKVYTWDLFDRI